MAKEIVQNDLTKVAALCKEVLGKSYETIERMGGLTNHTYHVKLYDGSEYVVRIPGEGTEELIVRADERVSTELACRLGIDAKCLYFGQDGSKVTEYIDGAVTMSAETLKEERHIEQMAAIFQKLHQCGADTGVPFEVFDMAAGYEKIIYDNQVMMYDDYQEVKSTVMSVKKNVDDKRAIQKVPCHNDALCENWVEDSRKRMYLIDWEYAGMNDGFWDLADVSIEAEYGEQEDRLLLARYLEKEPTSLDWQHFLANKIYVDYLWTLWAKTRVPFDGQPMEDWAAERYARLKSNIEEFKSI
ncbi:phosphotransferase [Candidatus Merdisoma sp. HCP28S3_D10]|uniref:phosphotransferase n=1 Tax=unclassified Candidatus Merdisoma TaxID=3099611 RepID=UPI003F8CAD4B